VVTLLLVACGSAAATLATPTPAPAAATGAKPTPGGSASPAAPAEQSKSATAVRIAAVKLPEDFQVQLYQGQEVLGGKDIQFSQLFAQGQPVVLNFFAGLCPPCRAEMPDFQAVSVQYQGRVLLFGLDIGPFVQLGSRKDGEALVKELRVTYPTGTTFDGKVVRAYQVLGMPTTVFLTPDGKVFRTWTGILTRAKMVELFEQLLKASAS
jgi:thiol-disulfide isomerase/thioredoxin